MALLALALPLLISIARRVVRVVQTLHATAAGPVLSRTLSSWVRRFEYDRTAFFQADGADGSLADRRSAGLDRLAATLAAQHARSAEWSAALRHGFSDLRFTDASRVPYPFARVM